MWKYRERKTSWSQYFCLRPFESLFTVYAFYVCVLKGACSFSLTIVRSFLIEFIITIGYSIKGMYYHIQNHFLIDRRLSCFWFDSIVSNVAITYLLILFFSVFWISFLESERVTKSKGMKTFVAFSVYCQITFQECCTNLNRNQPSMWIFNISLQALLYFGDTPHCPKLVDEN